MAASKTVSKGASDDRDHGNTDKGNTTDRGYGWDHQKKREELLEGDPKCHWCHDDKATQADHTSGGNLVPSCAPCNNERSHEQQKRAFRNDDAEMYGTWYARGQADAEAGRPSEFDWGNAEVPAGDAGQDAYDAYFDGYRENDPDRTGSWVGAERVAKLAYGEVKAPSQIDTLRIRECPVCGEEDSWDGDGRCRVCGYLTPPEPFRDPDLDVAQKADMRDGPINPELFKAPPFIAPEDKDGGEPDNKAVTEEPKPPTPDPSLTFRSSAGPVQQHLSPQKGQNAEGDPMSRPTVATVQTQAQIIERQRAVIATLRRRLGDIENPGNPVAEPGSSAPNQGTSNEDVRSADANTEVTTPGGVMPAPAPLATTTPTQPGAAASTDVLLVSNEAPTQTTDVTSPVGNAGTQPSLADTKTEIQPQTGGEAIGPNFLGPDEWANKAASIVRMTQEHTLASLHLARLRIEAGLATGSDLNLAQKIATELELPAIRQEIGTLKAVAAAKPAAPQGQSRTAARGRSVPSLVSTAAPMQRFAERPSMDPTDDEFLW